MALFVLPWVYVPDPTQSRALFNAKLYFGVADQDPVLFPKDVTLIQEDGSSIVAEQPIRTNSGGTPTYDNSPVAIDLTGDYSLRVLDRNDQQIYEYPSLVATDDNLTANALRAAALRLNLDADEIGTTLITNAEGQSLDNAEYLLDTNSGLLYSLPDDIPAGSTVVSSSGTTLVTSNGQFEMTPVWHYAVNRLIGNQIPVVEGSTGDPLPSAVATAYAINSEPAAGYEFVTAATNVTFDAGLWKGTGQLQRKYKRDAAGFISKSSEYAGVRLHDDTQLRALVDDIATNGCSVTDDVDYVYVTFELSDFPNGVKFPFIAAEVGTIAEIGDDDSFLEQTGLVDFFYSSTVNYEIHKSGKVRMWGIQACDAASGPTDGVYYSITPIVFPVTMTEAPSGVGLTQQDSADVHMYPTFQSLSGSGVTLIAHGSTPGNKNVAWSVEGV